MKKVRLKFEVDGLPYKVGQLVPVTLGIDGYYIWHVGTMMVTLPILSYEEIN
jgi:hypothetical protein